MYEVRSATEQAETQKVSDVFVENDMWIVVDTTDNNRIAAWSPQDKRNEAEDMAKELNRP